VPRSPRLRGTGLAGLREEAVVVLGVAGQGGAPFLVGVRPGLGAIRADRWLLSDAAARPGYRSYHAVVDEADDATPSAGVCGDDPYNIIYSSGTTGLPKGIVLSQRVRALYGTLFGLAWRMGPESVVLHS